MASKHSSTIPPTQTQQTQRAYYLANREKIRARSKARYEAKKAEILAQQKEHYQQNKEKVAERGRAYRERNREEVLRKKKEDYSKNKARYSQKMKEWAKRNKASTRERAKRLYQTRPDIRAKKAQYQRDNPQICNVHKRKNKAKRRSAKGRFTRAQLFDKFTFWGWRCYLCGKALTLKTAHIEHRIPITRGGSNWIANIAPACAGCNFAKGTKTESEYRQSLTQGHYLATPHVTVRV